MSHQELVCAQGSKYKTIFNWRTPRIYFSFNLIYNLVFYLETKVKSAKKKLFKKTKNDQSVKKTLN